MVRDAPRRGALLRVWCAGVGAAAVVSACGGGTAPSRLATVPAPPSTTAAPITNPRDTDPPPARSGAALAFDGVSGKLLLFGGATATDQVHPSDAVRLADTWAWDGNSWTHLQPATSPPSLYGAQLVADPTSGRLLLLSGSGAADASGALLQQGSWSWTGQTWQRVGDNPVQMAFAAAGADPDHHQMVISGSDPAYNPNCGLGRQSVCPSFTPVDQPGAYVWNGSAWAPAKGQPPKWTGAGTAFDPMSHQVISAGGAQQVGLQSTYAWDGRQWQVLSQSPAIGGVPDPSYPAGPCAAATDSRAGSIVMVCSLSSNGTAVGATWTFDGTNWTRAQNATTQLPAIQSLSVAYDPAVGAVVMVYPGTGATESMRMWNGNDWAAIPS